MKKNSEDKKASNASSSASRTADFAPAGALVGRPAGEWAPMPERRLRPRASPGPEFQEEVQRILLSRYTPAAVLVDDSFNVAHVHGNVRAALGAPEGAPAANLMAMARGELATAIRTAVIKAKSEDRTVSKTARFARDGQTAGLSIEVIAVRSRSDRRRCYLILLRPESLPGLPFAPAGAAGQLDLLEPGSSAGAVQARAEASAPEQLRRANQKLASAREELQSANAELVSVNEELRRGHADVSATNDDLSNLLASAQIPILMLDRNMRVRRSTPPAEAAFGVAASDIGQPLAALKLTIDAPFLKEAVRDVIAGFPAKQLEVRGREERWYSLWIRPYKTNARLIDGAVLSMIDVTANRRGMRALEAARDYAEAIVDTVNDSLLILNRHLKVTSASRFYYELFRCSPADIRGRSIYELGAGMWNVPALRQQLSALAAAETPFSGWEAEFDVPKLGRRTLAVSGRVVPHAEGEEPKIVVAIEDASLRKQAAEAAALRKSESRQRDFVANVSHELMTPIAAIKGYSESLVSGAIATPGRRVKFAQIIEKNADRLAQLVEDLLQLSAFDAGRAPAASETVLLRASVEKAARGLAAAARARGVALRILVPKTLRAAIGRDELAQVLQNLTANAIKYNRSKGRVYVRARRIGKRILVSLQDTGIGIPKADLPRIFDRFHRAENARLKTERGNGLGLSIARSILAHRGCRIWAESVEGKGTIVSFTLPHVEARRREAARPSRRGRKTVTAPQ
jgi:two-component system CheB/CheR fusion protein